VSATVAALDDAYTDADLFETVCQILADELDDAGTYELVRQHIRGKSAHDELALASFTCRKLKQLRIRDLWLATEWKLHLTSLPLVPSPVASCSSFLFGICGLPRHGNSLKLTKSKKSLACLVPPRLVPWCPDSIGITSLSRVDLQSSHVL
jgi:hypothetical protein